MEKELYFISPIFKSQMTFAQSNIPTLEEAIERANRLRLYGVPCTIKNQNGEIIPKRLIDNVT